MVGLGYRIRVFILEDTLWVGFDFKWFGSLKIPIGPE